HRASSEAFSGMAVPEKETMCAETPAGWTRPTGVYLNSKSNHAPGCPWIRSDRRSPLHRSVSFSRRFVSSPVGEVFVNEHQRGVRPRRRKAYSPLADGSQPGRLWNRPGDLQRVVTTPAVLEVLRFTRVPWGNTPSTTITFLPIPPALPTPNTVPVGCQVVCGERMST